MPTCIRFCRGSFFPSHFCTWTTISLLFYCSAGVPFLSLSAIVCSTSYFHVSVLLGFTLYLIWYLSISIPNTNRQCLSSVHRMVSTCLLACSFSSMFHFLPSIIFFLLSFNFFQGVSDFFTSIIKKKTQKTVHLLLRFIAPRPFIVFP
jgi:hypothetical protein